MSVSDPSVTLLTDMIKTYPLFQEMPRDQKELYLRLANIFQEDTDAIWCDAVELQQRFQVGNRHQWEKLLNLEPTVHYITSQMSLKTKVAARKAFVALQREASTGDVSAIKHLNDLAGILEKKDNNKVVILHQISRPTQEIQKSQPNEIQKAGDNVR